MKGFTIIENVVVVSLLMMVMVLGYLYMGRSNKERLLRSKAIEVKAGLDEQRRKAYEGTAFNEDSPLRFGVCFEDHHYTLFATQTDWNERDLRYSQRYELPQSPYFKDHNMPLGCEGGGNHAVLFNPISGEADGSGSITIYSPGVDQQYRIDISQSGLVQVE